jgi:hypothetical protein
MTSTEDRLRAATRAAAGTVPPGSAPPLHLPAEPGRPPARFRPARRPGWRWAAPLAAAAAVLTVLAASLALAHGAPGDRHAPATAKGHARGPARIPPYYVAMIAGGNLPAGGSKQYAEVRATGSGKVLATIRPPVPYRTFEAVTAAGDDRTFVLAAGPWQVSHRNGGSFITESPVKLFLLKLSATGHVARLTALPIPALAQPGGIALSPDGRRLAVVFNHERNDEMVDPVIRVFTLLDNGAVRTWVWHGRAWITSNDALNQQLMSWTADGRTLAYEQWLGDDEQVRLLDTTAPGTDLRASRLALDFRHQAYTDWKFTHGKVVDALSGYNALITPDGTKIIAGTDTVTKHPATDNPHFTVFSAPTGAALRELRQSVRKPGLGQSQDVLWVSPSGSAFIGSVLQPVPGQRADRSVIGILRGDHFTPLPGDWGPVTGVAW